MNEPKRFVAYGPGFSGDFATFAEAWACRMEHRNGAVYALVNADPVTWDLLGDARRDHVAALTDAQPFDQAAADLAFRGELPSATPDATRPCTCGANTIAAMMGTHLSFCALWPGPDTSPHDDQCEGWLDDATKCYTPCGCADRRAAMSGSPDEPASPECDGRCCDTAAVVRAFVQRVNARAEADMLAGNPVTGAHHRAIEVEVAALSTPALASPDEPRATDEPHEEMEVTFARDIRDAEIRGALWALDTTHPHLDRRRNQRMAGMIVEAERKKAASPHEGPTNG